MATGDQRNPHGRRALIGYRRAGYTQEEIAEEILPHLDLARIYAALSYYEDYRDEMDAYTVDNAPEAWRARLIKELGQEQAQALLGEK